MASLTDSLLGGSSEASKVPTQIGSLTDTLLSNSDTIKETKATETFDIEQLRQKNRDAFVRGLRDILDTGAHGLGRTTSYIADKILPEQYALPIKQSVNEMLTSDKAAREVYDKANPSSEGILPDAAEANRMAGQTIATLPLMPAKAFQAIKGAMGAIPTVNAVGQKVAAPLLNRTGAAAVTGGLGGAEFGALTSSTNDESTLANTGKGLITGALAGPVLVSAEAAGRNALPTLKNMWANVQVNKLVQSTGLEPTAVKNIISILENAGLTPKEAQLQLNKLGPSATLSDLANSITTEASGLASIGGKPTEILKSRYEARSKTANSNAANIMETHLGVKPNIEAEKEAIVKQARKDTSPDYKAAYKSGDVLDSQPVIDTIDKELKNAVGSKKSALLMLKEFMYKDAKDPSGNPIKVAKHGIDELHEIRQAIDDVMEKRQGAEGYGANALRAIESVRNAVDTQLKTNSAMAVADAKFAEKMTLKDAMDVGYNVLSGSRNGMNKEEFAKLFDNSAVEVRDAIKKGLRAKIGDLMERASRGELSEAQRLFGKSSLNRANIEKAFGDKGIQVLDALQKEATERATETAIRHGAQTAERQSIQAKYGTRHHGGGGMKDAVQGAVLDVVTGTPGGATAIMTAKRLGGNAALKISEGRRERLIEGTADLLSRQGAGRDIGLDVANRVKKIQNKIAKKYTLPVDVNAGLLAGPAGELTYQGYKNANKE